MARIVARKRPDAVRQVISLGSPFTGTPKATNVWRAYELMTGQKIDDAQTVAQLREGATAAGAVDRDLEPRGRDRGVAELHRALRHQFG
ncbi:hypothetical protein AB5I41_01760 [Sphingomonas sp. MMS24-JH45]